VPRNFPRVARRAVPLPLARALRETAPVMSPLALVHRLPPLDLAALRLDRYRARRVDDVLATRRGAVVEEVTEGSPAALAELVVGDVVVAIDGDPVNGAEALTAFVRERAAGSDATLTIVRDGAALDVEVTLAVRAEAAASATTPDGSSGWRTTPQDPQG